MKRFLRSLSVSALILLMVMSLAGAAFAESPTIDYNGKTEGFIFTPDDDLFPDFKNVMPGDTLTETITFTNNAKDCAYVKLYMRAEPHGAENQPVKVSEEVTAMNDFLSQLSMTVENGGTVIYSDSPDSPGSLASDTLLGTFNKGEKTELKVTLEVPADMGNEYALREGEVDWVFKVEAFDAEGNALIRTGQLRWPVWVLGGAGIVLVAFGALMLLKKKRGNNA